MSSQLTGAADGNTAKMTTNGGVPSGTGPPSGTASTSSSSSSSSAATGLTIDVVNNNSTSPAQGEVRA